MIIESSSVAEVRFAHRLQYLLLRCIQVPLSRVPLHIVRRFARRLGRFVFTVVRFRRVITLKNIAAAFPGESASVHLSMARSSFESVAVTLCEFMLFPTFDEQTMRRLVRVENEGLLRDEYARGKGVILLTAHYGSWECFAQAAGMVLGGHGRLLAKTQSNPLVHHAVDAWRKRFGFRTTASNLGVREVLAVLREGGWVVIAADQSAPRESPRIPFFGRPIPTYQGPAVFSLKTGAPLLLGLARRLEDDSYVIEFEKVPSDGLRADDENDVRELTRRHVAATERRIRMDPTQWMWMHRRWKHAGPDPGEDRA